MSSYTTQLRHICETYAGLTDQFDAGETQDIIESARTHVFDFDFPLYSSDYRSVLETKIIRHFYFREIGFETVAEFKFRLNTLLNEIMPYYNKLYESAELQYNPLYDTDYTTEHQGVGTKNGTVNGTIDRDADKDVSSRSVRDAEGTSSLTTNATTNESINDTINRTLNHWDKYSDTPQGSIQRIDLEQDAYLTNARHISETENTTETKTDNTIFSETKNGATTDDIVDTVTAHTDDVSKTETETQSTARTTDDYTRRVYGKYSGRTYPQMIREFRNALLNIDMLIINDLEPLFLAIYSF